MGVVDQSSSVVLSTNQVVLSQQKTRTSGAVLAMLEATQVEFKLPGVCERRTKLRKTTPNRPTFPQP